MSKKEGEHLQGHHNKGEKDTASNKHSPPHSITPLDRLTHSDKFVKHMENDNKAYKQGADNAKKQK